jgi:hypothetical protein
MADSLFFFSFFSFFLFYWGERRGVIMPHYIEGNGVLLLAGKGYVSVLELFPLDGSRADDVVSFRFV